MNKQIDGQIYNPHGLPAEQLPFIFGFNNGGTLGWLHAVLISESGHILGQHICSDESFMADDLGVHEGARPDRHADFRKHYPAGYRMAFVSWSDVKDHERLTSAIKRYEENEQAAN